MVRHSIAGHMAHTATCAQSARSLVCDLYRLLPLDVILGIASFGCARAKHQQESLHDKIDSRHRCHRRRPHSAVPRRPAVLLRQRYTIHINIIGHIFSFSRRSFTAVHFK